MDDTEQVKCLRSLAHPVHLFALLSPTVVCQSFFQQLFAEQNVDIPVPGARGLLDRGGLQGSVPGQSSTASSQGGLHGSVPGHSSTVSFCEGTQGLLPKQGSTAPRGADSRVGRQSLVPGQGSTAFSGAHHASPQSFLSGQGSPSFGGPPHYDFESEDLEEGVEKEEVLGEVVDESIDRFKHSSFRPRRLCSHFMAGCCGRGWICTSARTRAPSSFPPLSRPQTYQRRCLGVVQEEQELDSSGRRLPSILDWFDSGYSSCASSRRLRYFCAFCTWLRTSDSEVDLAGFGH